MKIKCPACAAVLNIPESAAGKVVKCPCGKQLRAPGGAASKPASPARPASGGPARPATPRPGPSQPSARQPTSQGLGSGGFDAAMFDELTDQDLKPVKAVANPRQAPAAPKDTGGKLLQQYASAGDARADMLLGPQKFGELAGPGSRILAVMLDGLFYMLFVGVGIGIVALMFASGGAEEPDPTKLDMGFWVIVGSYALPKIVNVALISMSGQTVGKKIMGIRICSQITGAPASFLNGFLIREVGFGFFTGLPLIGPFIALADCVYLFFEGHETLHDKLASTVVTRV